jgi:hypothetical protein
MLEILATLVLYICEIRKVRQNLGEEKQYSDFSDICVVHQNREEENPSGFFAVRKVHQNLEDEKGGFS